MKLSSSYCGPPKSPSPVRVSYIWYDLDREVFMSVCVEPRKEVPRKHQDTSRNRIRKPIGNSSTIVPDTDDECPRSEAKGTNLMFPTGPALCLEDSPTLSRWSSEGCEVDCGAPWSDEALAAEV